MSKNKKLYEKNRGEIKNSRFEKYKDDNAATLLIRLYRKILSPIKTTPSCRFTPTCSKYVLDAIKEWGLLFGLSLALWRVLRCNPFGKGGYDPVPENFFRRKSDKK